MNKVSNIARQRDVRAALGSVRAEGLKPSQKTQRRLNDYANGKISGPELRRVTIQEMQQRSRNTISE